MQLSLAIDDYSLLTQPERLEGVESVSGLFRYQLDVLVKGSRSFQEMIGKGVSFSLDSGEEKRLWHGMIKRVRRGGVVTYKSGRYTRYHFVIVPRLWLLTRSLRSRIFQGLSAVQALEKVLQGQDATLPKEAMTPREYCVQYAESDFAFASRLMEDEGIFYFFDETKSIMPGEGKHPLVLGYSNDQFPAVTGRVEWRVDQPFVGGLPTNAILTWEKSQAITASSCVLRDYDHRVAGQGLNAQQAILDNVQVGTETHPLRFGANQDMEVYEYPGGIRPGKDSNQANADQSRRAALRAQEAGARSLRIDGTSTCAHFRAGQMLTLIGETVGTQAGKYLLTRVRHRAVMDMSYLDASGPLRPEKGTYENTFRCLPAALQYRPPRRTPRPVIAGPQTAVVIGDVEETSVKDQDGKELRKEYSVKADQEVVVDDQGRIKVQFHWDRQGVLAPKDEEKPTFNYWAGRQGDKPAECWLRFAQPLAGRGWGHIAIPRVGHEVLVGFLGGDPDRPVVLGSLYNSANVPPFRDEHGVVALASGWKSHTGYSTFTEDKFNGIAFNDTKDKEIAYLQAQRNLILRTKKHLVTQVAGNRYEDIAGDRMKLTGSLPSFGAPVPGKDDHKAGDHHGDEDFEGHEEHEEGTMWKWGVLEAKWGKEIEMIYGLSADVLTGFKMGALIGGKLELSINPFDMLPPTTATEGWKSYLGVLRKILGFNDFTLGNKFDVCTGHERTFHVHDHAAVAPVDPATAHAAETMAKVVAIIAVLESVAIGGVGHHSSSRKYTIGSFVAVGALATIAAAVYLQLIGGATQVAALYARIQACRRARAAPPNLPPVAHGVPPANEDFF